MKFKELIESVYDDRVSKFVHQVTGGSQHTVDDLKAKIDHTAKYSEHAVERRIGGKALDDFKKDALNHAKSKDLIKKKEPAERSKFTVFPRGEHYNKEVPVYQKDVDELHHKISDAIGNSYPDGDPHDAITQHVQRKGWEPSSVYDKVVPHIVKKHFGFKSGQLTDVIHDAWKDADSHTGYDSAKHWK